MNFLQNNHTDLRIKKIGIVELNKAYKPISGGDYSLNYLKEKLKENNIEVVSIPTSYRLKKFDFANIFIGTLKQIFTQPKLEVKDIDLIISFDPYPINVLTALKLRSKYKIPCVVYIHHIPLQINVYPFRRGFIRVLLYNFYFSLLLKLFRVYSVPIFLDNPNTLKGFKNVYPHLDALPENVVKFISKNAKKEYDICYVGRLQKHKGVEDIIKTVKFLKEKHGLKTRTVLIGSVDPKYKKKLFKIIEKYDLNDYIYLTGYLDDSEKYELMSKSKIFVSLSYEEGWGLSVMEAAALGIPVVAYDLPAYYYLKNNYYKARLGDIMDAADTIAYVLKHYDEALKIAAKAQSLVMKITQDLVVRQQIIFYKRIKARFNNLRR